MLNLYTILFKRIDLKPQPKAMAFLGFGYFCGLEGFLLAIESRNLSCVLFDFWHSIQQIKYLVKAYGSLH